MFVARSVVTDNAVSDALYEIYGGAETADDALLSFMFLLSRKPDCGVKVTEDVWCLEMEDCGIWKHVFLYYTHDANQVVIRDIELVAHDGE